MKNLSRLAVMAICLLLTAIFTSACGGGGKTTPPTYPYWLLTQNNNEEEPTIEDSNLTLTDSLNAEQIATADIYYSVDGTAKSSDNDQEILKAEPTANDKTKFKLPDNIDIPNTKIKAIITYDSTGKCLDYFSSYNGVESENNAFNVNFENSNGDFGGGTGTEDDPYLISQPRHFVNINKQDDQGNYLYLNKNFKQTEDLDFSHLTGLKINKANEDKDITIETVNQNAPLYNDGQGIIPIGKDNEEATSEEEAYLYYFQGTYDGNKKAIDGIMFVNPQEALIGLFTGLNNGTLQNLTIGENSIFFIDKNNESYSNCIGIGGLAAYPCNSTLENCTNNAKIVIKNLEIDDENHYHHTICGISSFGYNTQITNCTNNGNITVDNCKFYGLFVNGIAGEVNSFSADEQNTIDNCINNGNITITNNKNVVNGSNLILYISGIIGETYNENNNAEITNCTNNGNIIVKNNSNLSLKSAGIIAQAFTVNVTTCANKGNITIAENTVTEDIYCDIYAYGITIISNSSNTQIAEDCTNEGTITATEEDNPNYIISTGEIAGSY